MALQDTDNLIVGRGTESYKIEYKELKDDIGTGGSSNISVGDTPPVSPEDGDLWWNSSDDSGRLYVYYDDGNSSQWVEASPQGDSDAADDLYLSKVNDDTAAGKITFAEDTYFNKGINFHSESSRVTQIYSPTDTGTLTVLAGNSKAYLCQKDSATSTNIGVVVDPKGGSNNTGFYVDLPQGEISAGYHTNNRDGAAGTRETYGFKADGDWENNFAAKNYGFYSGVNNNNEGTRNNFNFYAAGDAPSYFGGLTTHEGGVEVTGELPIKAGSYGIEKGGDSLTLLADGAAVISAKSGRAVSLGGLNAYGDAIVSIKTVPDDKYTGDLYGIRFNVPDAPNLTGSSNVYGFEARYNATKSLNSFTGFIAQKGSWGAGVGAAELKGFAVETGFSNDAGTAYGFYSNIDISGDVVNPFNFYAAGDAPNYFAGRTESQDGFIANASGSTPGEHGDRYVKMVSSANPVFAWLTNISNARNVLTITNGYGNISNIVADSTETIFRAEGSNTVRIESPSDYRLKTDINPISSASDAIKALNPVTYRMIAYPEKLMSGFIAHELQEQVSEAVTGAKDATQAIGTLADYDGTVLETEVTEPPVDELEYTEEVETDGVTTQTVRTRTWTPSGNRPVYQGVDQTKLIPLLTKALQEVMQKNEDLEARIAALEGA